MLIFKILPDMLFCFNLYVRYLWYTLLNTVDISANIALTTRLSAKG